jgi:hypothetical protein
MGAAPGIGSPQHKVAVFARAGDEIHSLRGRDGMDLVIVAAQDV